MLEFYKKEYREFKEIHRIYIPTQREAQIIVNKLTRHYKMKPIKLIFTKRKKNAGAINVRNRIMKLHPYVFSLSLLTHEVAHQMLYDQTGKSGHIKKLMTRIRRLNRYCEKMNYWGYKVEYVGGESQ